MILLLTLLTMAQATEYTYHQNNGDAYYQGKTVQGIPAPLNYLDTKDCTSVQGGELVTITVKGKALEACEVPHD